MLQTVKHWCCEAEREGKDPLCLASAAGALKGVQALLEYKSNNSDNKKTTSSLRHEYTRRYLQMSVDQRLQSTESNETSNTALRCITMKRKVGAQIAAYLVEQGIDLEAVNFDDLSALGVAASEGKGDMVAYLISQKANVHSNIWFYDCVDWSVNVREPVYVAAFNKHEDIVKDLLLHGVNWGTRDPRNYSLLHLAAKKGLEQVASALISWKENMEEEDEEFCYTALHFAVQAGHFGVTSVLLEAKADLEAKTDYGTTPLHVATIARNFVGASLLISRQANVNSEDNVHRTPLHFASEFNNLSIGALLISFKANVNARNQRGETPLDLAANDEIASYLAKHGAKEGCA